MLKWEQPNKRLDTRVAKLRANGRIYEIAVGESSLQYIYDISVTETDADQPKLASSIFSVSLPADSLQDAINQAVPRLIQAITAKVQNYVGLLYVLNTQTDRAAVQADSEDQDNGITKEQIETAADTLHAWINNSLYWPCKIQARRDGNSASLCCIENHPPAFVQHAFYLAQLAVEKFYPDDGQGNKEEILERLAFIPPTKIRDHKTTTAVNSGQFYLRAWLEQLTEDAKSKTK